MKTYKVTEAQRSIIFLLIKNYQDTHSQSAMDTMLLNELRGQLEIES